MATAVLSMIAMAILAMTSLTLAPFGNLASASAPPSTVETTLPPNTQPPISANDFIPDERDLTSCIGVLERPGCGSESRGGWRQTLVFGALFVGLVIVFGNVARGVHKRNR